MNNKQQKLAHTATAVSALFLVVIWAAGAPMGFWEGVLGGLITGYVVGEFGRASGRKARQRRIDAEVLS